MNRESSQPIRPETLLTSYQVGSLLQVNPSSVNKWVKDGRIPAFRTPGGHRRIRASDLVLFLTKHEMPVPPSLAQAARRRLLVVSASQHELQSVQRLLQGHADQLEIEICDNGVDALVKVGSSKPNVVLLEARLPGIDGFEICRRLRDNPETSQVRVLIASDTASSDVEQRAKQAGALECLGRPLDASKLLRALDITPSASTDGT